MIIIKNQIKILFLLLFIYGCSAQNKNTNNECVKANIESDTSYSGGDKNIALNMNDFNSDNDKSLDIVRILLDSGYETKEHFKRVYIAGGKLYVVENDVMRELPKDKMDIIGSAFNNLTISNTLVTCKGNSSRRYTYRYFVRVNNKLIMSFTANSLPNSIDKALIKDELKFITLFEDLK